MEVNEARNVVERRSALDSRTSHGDMESLQRTRREAALQKREFIRKLSRERSEPASELN